MFSDQHPTAPALLTTQQAADRLGLTTTSLHDLRCKDDGLPIVQKGLQVGYARTFDLDSTVITVPVTLRSQHNR